MKTIRLETTMNATVSSVWELLKDVSLYHQWNPPFTKATGILEVGHELGLDVKLPDIPLFSIKAMVQDVKLDEGFAWRYSWGASAISTWRYSVRLENIPAGRTRCIQTSEFGGLLWPLFGLSLGNPVRKGLADFDSSLRRWCEKGNVRCMKC